MLTRDRWDPDRMMDGWHDWGMTGAGVWFMLLVTVLLVALLATALVLLLRTPPTSPTPPPSARTSAREVLDLRLARGEIDRDEYAALRGDLGG